MRIAMPSSALRATRGDTSATDVLVGTAPWLAIAEWDAHQPRGVRVGVSPYGQRRC